jgi:hypothetical protein
MHQPSLSLHIAVLRRRRITELVTPAQARFWLHGRAFSPSSLWLIVQTSFSTSHAPHCPCTPSSTRLTSAACFPPSPPLVLPCSSLSRCVSYSVLPAAYVPPPSHFPTPAYPCLYPSRNYLLLYNAQGSFPYAIVQALARYCLSFLAHKL